MKFDLVDIDFRHVFYCNERSKRRLPGRSPLCELGAGVYRAVRSDHQGERRHRRQFRRRRLPLRLGRRTRRRLQQSVRLRQGVGEFPGRRIPGNYLQSNANDPVDRPNRLARSPARLDSRLRGGHWAGPVATVMCGSRPATWSAAG